MPNPSAFHDLICIIPTHNRSHFLRRQFTYMRQAEILPPLWVVDSSGPEHRELNQALIRNLAPQPCRYVWMDASVVVKSVWALREAKTPFATFCADDDFLSPFGVLRCLKHLRNDPGCASAMGRTYFADTEANSLKIGRGFRVIDADPLSRLDFFCANWYSNYYGVHRRENLLRHFEIVHETIDDSRARILAELLLSALAVIDGTQEFIDEDYMIFQFHSNNYCRRVPAVEDLTSADEQLTRFKNALLDAWRCIDPAGDADRAWDRIDATTERCFSRYRRPGERRRLHERLLSEIKKAIRRIRGVKTPLGYMEPTRLHGPDSIECEMLRIAHDLLRAFPAGMPAGTTFRAAA